MKIRRIHAGEYITADGRYKIEHQGGYESECEEPHPVRISLDTLARYSPWYQDHLRSIGTIRGKYLNYYCEGNEGHEYFRWIVWDQNADDYAADTGPSGFDSYLDARAFTLGLYT